MMVETLFGIVWDFGIHLDMGLSSGMCWAQCCFIFIRYAYCLLYRIIMCCIVITTKRLFTLVVISSYFLVALQLFTSLTVPHSRQESFLK